MPFTTQHWKFLHNLLTSIGLLAAMPVLPLGAAAQTDPVTTPAAEAPRTPAWSSGPNRYFAAGTFDTGFLYIRPRVSFGYGQPHDTWIGIDTNPLFSAEGVAAYAGLRFALPWVNLRIGGRGRYTFERAFLCPTVGFERPTRCDNQEPIMFYNREDIESRLGPRSVYLTLETELTFDVPAGPGKLVSELALSHVNGVDDNYFVYEETIKVVLDPPWVWRTRFGYAFPLDPQKAIRISVVGELVGLPGREEVVVRGGFTGSVRLYHNLEARGIFIPVLKSKDALGADGGDTFLLGIRYRWATH